MRPTRARASRVAILSSTLVLLAGCARAPGGIGAAGDGGTDGGAPGVGAGDGGTADGGPGISSPGPGPWGPATQLATGATLGPVHLAAFSGGRALAVWGARDAQGHTGAWASTFDPASGWSAPEALDDAPGGAAAIGPPVLAAAGDAAIVAWTEAAAPFPEVVVRDYAPASGFAAQGVMPRPPLGSYAALTDLALTLAPDGAAAAVFAEKDTAGARTATLWLSFRDTAGTWGVPASGQVGYPGAVVLTGDTHAWVSYAETDPATGIPPFVDWVTDWTGASPGSQIVRLDLHARGPARLVLGADGVLTAAWTRDTVGASQTDLGVRVMAQRLDGSAPPVVVAGTDTRAAAIGDGLVAVPGGLVAGLFTAATVPGLDGQATSAAAVYAGTGWAPATPLARIAGAVGGEKPPSLAANAGGTVAFAQAMAGGVAVATGGLAGFGDFHQAGAFADPRSGARVAVAVGPGGAVVVAYVERRPGQPDRLWVNRLAP